MVEYSLDRDESHRLTDEPVTADVGERDGATVVTVRGKVFYDTLAPLTDALAGLTAGQASRVVLDLSEVPMCDSSGLNLFVRTRADLVAAGGWLRLAGTRPMVDNVLHITNLDRLLPRYPTVEDALTAP
jgi:anti-anti-sigma factor